MTDARTISLISGISTPLIVFLDENHSRNPYLLRSLNTASVQVEPLSNHFPPGTPDVQWLPEVGARQWSLLTTDAQIRYNYIERAAVRAHKVRMFYFTRNDIGGPEMGEALRLAIPQMQSMCFLQAPPFAASITRAGKVTLRDTFPSP